MWTISSNSLQQAKQDLELRRTEIEARYAGERQMLDAEYAVIETLERAASEFMLRHARLDDADATEPLPDDAPGGGEADYGAPQPAFEASEGGLAEVGAEPAAPLSAGESGSAETHEMSGSLDILKPGSRWRLYRSGARAQDGEGSTAEGFSGR